MDTKIITENFTNIKPNDLGKSRELFTCCLALLLTNMIDSGYNPRIGKDGLKHMPSSLHYDGLAADIDLFKEGKYLTATNDHRPFGEYWENLHPLCFWGGDGKKSDGLRYDGNHYSVTYQGKK